jgi:hypothetical protein
MPDLAVPRRISTRTPLWWRAVGLLQWLLVVSAVAGLLWLLLRYALFALALPEPPTPHVGRVPLFTALFVGGLLAGLLLAVVVRPIVSLAARRRRRRITVRLNNAVRQVGEDLVLRPVTQVWTRYDEARAALTAAAVEVRRG